MSKKKAGTPDKKEAYKFPTRYGSHAMMINEAKTAALNDPKLVVLTDEFGDYTTERIRLDNGCADANRYPESRLGDLFKKSQTSKKD